MDGSWCAFICARLVYVRDFMISFISKAILVLLGALMVITGCLTILSPDINNIFLPLKVDASSVALATMIRTYAGFFVACGYLTIRFVYSSSKVQIGSVLLYIWGCMLIARIISLLFDGITNYALITLGIGILLYLALYVVQKKRRNQISYDL